jgi:NAD(P)-dependent dehydrogenase (short-subunit alcohol dehydrogenase family)
MDGRVDTIRRRRPSVRSFNTASDERASMADRVQGQTAIVTGAASGIGFAIARRLGEEGAEILVADIDAAGAKEAADELADERIDAAAIECDVTDREDTATMVDATVERFGGVDALVNNAGIATRAEFADLEPEQWDEVIDVNLTGVFNCSYAAAPELVNGGGAIVNISSMAGRDISYHAAANYTASKWGVIGFTKHLAWDLADHGVRVNAVCPGSTLTPLIEAETTPEARAETEEKIPLNRWSDPEDQADGVCYLVSDEADYVTGTVLEIDGGKQLGVRHEI